MSNVTTLTEAVRTAVEGVLDPELPAVTIGMLGMIHDVRVDEGRVEVELLPTWSGCPATDVIGADVAAAVRAVPGVTDVTVRFRFAPPWTSDRINAEGRERLREFGITPPVAPHDAQPGTDVYRLRPDSGANSVHVGLMARRACPYCGSDDTSLDSAFGPTPCRSIHLCASCRQPFEAFKAL